MIVSISLDSKSHDEIPISSSLVGHSAESLKLACVLA